MANTLTSLGAPILAQTSLDVFTKKIAPLTQFSSNFMVEPAQYGDTVQVLSIAEATAAVTNFPSTNAFTIQDSSAKAIDVSLNQRPYVSWNLTTTEMRNNPQVQLQRFAAEKGGALAEAVIADIWGLITSANFGSATNDVSTITAANFDSDSVAELAQKANAKNWPEDQRFLFVSPAYLASLMQDSSIKNADDFGNASASTTGQVTRKLFGFDVILSNIIPGNSENLECFAINPEAIAIGSRVLMPQDPANVVRFEVLMDEELGVGLGYREFHEVLNDRTDVILDFSYGRAVANSEAVIRVVSS